jgi:hypothetical protein
MAEAPAGTSNRYQVRKLRLAEGALAGSGLQCVQRFSCGHQVRSRAVITIWSEFQYVPPRGSHLRGRGTGGVSSHAGAILTDSAPRRGTSRRRAAR